ncbi:putative uncharacterized protein ENSP00000383309 [Ptychodera flava]|uniref:putative uncharacterized protein ENSP00000383309 n=1 Tax=Ptychodera flava TaxID=63121 RepID=UPI00396A9008
MSYVPGSTLFATFVVMTAMCAAFNCARDFVNVDSHHSPRISPLLTAEGLVVTHAVVAGDNKNCSQVGKAILQQCGNAVDSAIATMLCTGVVNTHSVAAPASGLERNHSLGNSYCFPSNVLRDQAALAPLVQTESIWTATKIAPAKSMASSMKMTDAKVQIPTAPLTRRMPPEIMTASMMTDVPMPTQAPTKLAVTEAIQTATKIAPTKSMTYSMKATDTKVQIPTAPLTRKMPSNTMTASIMTDAFMPTQAPTNLAITEAIQTATKIAPTKSMTFVMETDTKAQIPTAPLTRKMPPNTMTASMVADVAIPTQASTKLAVTEAIQTATKIAPTKSMTYSMKATETWVKIPTAPLTRKMPPNTMTASMMADVPMPTQAPTNLQSQKLFGPQPKLHLP